MILPDAPTISGRQARYLKEPWDEFACILPNMVIISGGGAFREMEPLIHIWFLTICPAYPVSARVRLKIRVASDH